MRGYFVLICIASLGLAFVPHISVAQVSGYVISKDASFSEGLAVMQKAQADPRQTNEFYYAYLGVNLGWRKIGDGNKDVADASGLPAIYAERRQANTTDPVYLIHIHPGKQGELEFGQPSGGDLLIAANSKLDPNNRRGFEEINLVVESRGVWSYGVRTDAAAERLIRDDKTLLSNPLFADPAIQADILKYKTDGVFPNGFTVAGNDRFASYLIKDITANKYGVEAQKRLLEAFKNADSENFFIVQNIAIQRYARGTITYEELKKLYDSYGLSLSRGDAEATAAAVEQTNSNDTFGIKPTVQKDGTLEAGKGLVPCSGFNCSVCDVVVMANTGIKFLLTLSFLFFAVLAVYAGVKLVISQGNSSALSSAKQSFTNAFIGLIIILVAWLIVDTMMRQLLKGGNGNIDGYGPWSKVQCTEQTDVKPAQTKLFEGDAEFVSGSAAAGTGGPGVTPTGKLVTYSGRQFDSAVVDKIKYIDENFVLTVTGGYRTVERNNEVNGSDTSYHLSGRAGDFDGTRSEMDKAAAWAKANGAREVLIHNAGNGLHLHVAW